MQQQNYELSLLITALATVRAQRGLGAAGKRLAGSRGDAGTQRGEQGAELPPPALSVRLERAGFQDISFIPQHFCQEKSTSF